MNPSPPKPDAALRPPDSPEPAGGERPPNLLKRYRHVAWSLLIGALLAAVLAVLPDYFRAELLRGLRTQAPLIIMLSVFSLLALSLLWSKGQRMDAWAFLYFNLRGTRPLWLDWIMLGITQLGNGVAAVAGSLALYFAHESRLAYELILGTLTLWLVVEVVKSIAHRSRPFVRLTQTRIVGYRQSGLSFPSGHTSQAFFLAAFLAQHYPLSLGVALLVYAVALWVGVTRMYVGAHYPRDVLAGAILGSVWGVLAGWSR
jgi:membrane-associated phospholipid phosphatase